MAASATLRRAAGVCVLLLACATAVAAASAASPGEYVVAVPDGVDAGAVKEVHLVMSNHLDVGFNTHWCTTDGPFAYQVINEYFNQYFPGAIATAEGMAKAGTDKFRWMTQPWLVSLFLDCEDSGIVSWDGRRRPLLQCPNASAVQAFKAAVADGTIYMHAFPHNAELGLMTPSLLESSVRMSVQAAADAGQPGPPRVLSQRDVPGMSRATLPVLNRAGVLGVSVGAGGASGGNAVLPPLFVWRDEANGAEVVFMYDHGYSGGTFVLPNGTAMHTAWNIDNAGPFDVSKAQAAFAGVRKAYPNAKVFASTFDAFLDAALPQKGLLPVVTQEIGDTWEYGVPSDPVKVSHFGEVQRLRDACVAAGKCNETSIEFQRFDRLLNKVAEHTWGEAITWYLADYVNWSNEAFHAKLAMDPLPANYNTTIQSWLEQRSYIPNAIDLLGNHVFAEELRQALAALGEPTVPTPAAQGYTKVENPTTATFTCSGTELGFGADGSLTTFSTPTSSISSSSAGAGGTGGGGATQAWASATQALATFSYQTADDDDYRAFLNDYGMSNCDLHTFNPGCNNFMKMNSSANAKVVRRDLTLAMDELWSKPAASTEACSFYVLGHMPDEAVVNAGAMPAVWMSVDVAVGDHASDDGGAAGAAPVVTADIQVMWFNKTATRLAEASWLSFNPAVSQPDTGWRVSTLGSLVDPTDVVEHGATHLHLSTGMTYCGPEGTFNVTGTDVPVVSAGIKSMFPTPSSNTTLPANMAQGMHWNLHQNAWDTNYVMWTMEAAQLYRMQLSVQAAS